MAEVLDDFGHKDTKYPWSEWLDGRPWHLVEGEDYEVSTTSFRGSAWVAAKRRGGRVRSRCVDDGVVVQFQPSSSTDDPLL
jgi:hypothetical protein